MKIFQITKTFNSSCPSSHAGLQILALWMTELPTTNCVFQQVCATLQGTRCLIERLPHTWIVIGKCSKTLLDGESCTSAVAAVALNDWTDWGELWNTEEREKRLGESEAKRVVRWGQRRVAERQENHVIKIDRLSFGSWCWQDNFKTEFRN